MRFTENESIIQQQQQQQQRQQQQQQQPGMWKPSLQIL